VDLGHLIPRVMRVYGMGYREVMALPMRVFWHLQGSIGRLLAEEARDQLEISTTSHNPEQAVELRTQLDAAAPPAIQLTAEALMQRTATADPEAADTLRSLAG
jgi:hypothetical protein